MVASLGKIASPLQGTSYFERGGYYGRDDPVHKELSAWAGRGAEEFGLSGPVNSDAFQAVLEGKVPAGASSAAGISMASSSTVRAGT